MDFDFGQVDLTNVEAGKGRSSPKPGPHTMVVRNPEIVPTKAKGRQLKIELVTLDGSSRTTDYITMAHPEAATNEKAAMSVAIGKERLKDLLVNGGHPNPNKPGSVKSLDGLIVGVNIVEGDPWTDDKGVVRKGGGKPAKSGAYFKPPVTGAGGSSTSKKSDDIPF